MAREYTVKTSIETKADYIPRLGHVARNQILYFNPAHLGTDPTSKVNSQLAFFMGTPKVVTLKNEDFINDNFLVPIIRDAEIYADAVSFITSDSMAALNALGFYFNEVVYNNDHLPDTIPPTIKREGDSRFWPYAEAVRPKVVDWKTSFSEKDKQNCKVGIGVIDFGFNDPHGHFIKQIIEQESSDDNNIEIVDYYALVNDELTVHSLCKQIYKGIDEEIDILNISLGYYTHLPTPNPILETVIQNALGSGRVIVCSAGNASLDLDKHWHFPSNIEGTCSVGSCYSRKNQIFRTDYSNYSSSNSVVHVYVNGEYGVDATNFGQTDLYSDNSTVNQDTIHGTSFSTAFISAQIALSISEGSKKENDQCKKPAIDLDKILNRYQRETPNLSLRDKIKKYKWFLIIGTILFSIVLASYLLQ